METMTTKTSMQQAALTRAEYQDPSVHLGIRCVQGDPLATRGQLRPIPGAGVPVRVRPATRFAVPQPVGFVLPGGSRYMT